MGNVKRIQREIDAITALDGKKKRSFKVKFAGIFFTAVLFTIISLPIVGLGILIGWFIWG